EREEGEPQAIIESLGLRQISDSGALRQAIEEVVHSHPGEVRRYKAGDQKLFGFFVGQAMKVTKGKGNPQEIGKILKDILSADSTAA
ncbi:MAG: hypothetical protein JW795_02720, partial [Chitinivibrionales bacterium]|nr:hypothetical protein [Chitinivibrionales bacterium]